MYYTRTTENGNMHYEQHSNFKWLFLNPYKIAKNDPVL